MRVDKVHMDNHTDEKVCPDLAGWIEDEEGPKCIGLCKREVIEEYRFEEPEKEKKLKRKRKERDVGSGDGGEISGGREDKRGAKKRRRTGPVEVAIYEETDEEDAEEAVVSDPGALAFSNSSAGNSRSYGFLHVRDLEPGVYESEEENDPVEEAEEELVSEDMWEGENVN
ncbi:hypothetical protein IFR05_006111 [Cadophora sp. M221]|nr:hypothetical protein IFR05_006111 [Cadophora sp. M221]